ncbi:hypothetical protein CK203_032186 [Vitis vinifera]|uniref:GBF-interacting protein 1 N-terminal domain-containing protein n=1 Tax=Vitis vinifera TaxID=29760 RepID=A0A438IPP8_VITVI|nr:hypothetical protein CK203_032186 [Vitis vinifera]
MDRDCDEGEGGGGDGLPEIPMEAWEMIERVKEIMREYTDDEIYAMLLECEMDLNETVQRLLSPGRYSIKNSFPCLPVWMPRKLLKEKDKKSRYSIKNSLPCLPVWMPRELLKEKDKKSLRFLFSAFSCLDAEKTGEREGKESEGLRQRCVFGLVQIYVLLMNPGDDRTGETFERVKEERERRKEEKIAEEKRLHDIGSSSDFGDRGGSHRHSENTSYKGESSFTLILDLPGILNAFVAHLRNMLSSEHDLDIILSHLGTIALCALSTLGCDSAADEYKRQSIGAGDAISSAQSSQVLQPARPGARGRASVADIVRRGRPGTRRHVSKADVVGMGGPGANTSSLPITSTGTSPPLVGAVPEQCGVPNTSSPLITLDEACFPPLGRTPKRSSYHVTPPFVPSPVEAEPHQALHSPNPCDTAETSQDCQPHEVEASVSSEQLAEYSASVSSAAAGLEKLSMEKGETLSGLPTAHSSLHKLNRLQCELGEATGALVDDSSSGNLDFRNPENHGDEQPRIIPDADRENSASSCARERQGIVGPSLSSEAFMAEQIQSLRHSSGGSYSSRPTNFVPEDVRQDTFSVSGLPSQALPSIHIAPETTLPRPFALDPDTQHSVSLEHSDNMLAGPSPAQSYASIPSTFQQAHTDEDLSHLLLPELLQDIQQYRNRAPETTLPRPFALDPDTQHSVSLEHSDNMLAGPSPPPSYASIPSAFQQAHTDEDPSHLLLPELLQDIQQYRNRAPETTLPRPFALDPDTQHSVSLEHSDNMRAGPSPPPSYASIPSAFQQAHTDEDPSHLLLPELLQDIQQYRNRAPVSHLAQPPAGYGNFGGPTNIPPAGHRSFGAPTYIPPADHRSFGSPTYIPPTGHQSFRSLAYIPPAGHRSFGRPTYIPPTGHQSFRSPAYIPPAGHGRFGSATYIPPADYGSLGSPSNIPSRFLNNLPASMNLDEFLRSNEGAHFNPHQGGSSATWVRGPGGSRAIPPAAGSTHYYGLPEQNQQYPRDEGNQRLLQQHRSQGYQTPDGSQSRDPRGRWP